MDEQNPFFSEKQIIKNFSKKYCLHPNASENECKGEIQDSKTISGLFMAQRWLKNR